MKTKNLLEIDVEHHPKTWVSSLRMSPPNFDPKYPHSCQTIRNDHVENEQEDQSVPSQQLKKNQLYQREDEYTQ